MNRNSGCGSLRDSMVGYRYTNNNNNNHNHNPNGGSQLQHRRGQSLTPATATDENNLDLFSRNRRGLSIADVSVKLGRVAVGSGKLARDRTDDLLTSTDGGKHDYDWLLTPPGTPLFPSSDGSESRPAPEAPRSTPLARSASTAKASRLSVSQSESVHSSRQARSSSVTRPSLSSSQFSTYSSNRYSNILNTSSASVSSYMRPSSPITRSPSTARSSAPSAQPTPSRPSTPSRARPTPTSLLVDKPRPSQNSRPSTPSSRAQATSSLSSAPARSNSRPSTPTRRNLVPSLSPASVPSASVGRGPLNGRISAPSSRPSSPSPRVRPLQQPVVPPDFPLDTPPNLRTSLPDRPLSAGRSRPGAALTVKENPEINGSANGPAPRRHSSPIITRGRLPDPPGKGRVHSNGHAADKAESRKASHASQLGMQKPVKSTSTLTESTGFGRTISKKSMDMAIRHMDIRSGSGGARSLSSTALFPQSIRSATTRAQSFHSSIAPESLNKNDQPHYGGNLENGNHVSRLAEIGGEANEGRCSAKFSEIDIYESSRYDAMLLKEDLKNMNWLHNIDDKSDQGPIFDSGFEPLPEPFGLL